MQRAEITLFETARAYAALDGRQEVSSDDINVVMPMALRLRRSTFIEEFFKELQKEDREIEGQGQQTEDCDVVRGVHLSLVGD